MNENKREILEAVAAAEKQLRPFEDSIAGVDYEDIRDEFDASDFGVNPTAYIPLRLWEMAEDADPSLLQYPYKAGDATNMRYRLTEYGWKFVDEDRP